LTLLHAIYPCKFFFSLNYGYRFIRYYIIIYIMIYSHSLHDSLAHTHATLPDLQEEWRGKETTLKYYISSLARYTLHIKLSLKLKSIDTTRHDTWYIYIIHTLIYIIINNYIMYTNTICDNYYIHYGKIKVKKNNIFITPTDALFKVRFLFCK